MSQVKTASADTIRQVILEQLGIFGKTNPKPRKSSRMRFLESMSNYVGKIRKTAEYPYFLVSHNFDNTSRKLGLDGEKLDKYESRAKDIEYELDRTYSMRLTMKAELKDLNINFQKLRLEYNRNKPAHNIYKVNTKKMSPERARAYEAVKTGKFIEKVDMRDYGLSYTVANIPHTDKFKRTTPLPLVVEFMNKRYKFIEKARQKLYEYMLENDEIKNMMVNETNTPQQRAMTMKMVSVYLNAYFIKIILLRKIRLPDITPSYRKHGRVNPLTPTLYDNGAMVRGIHWFLTDKGAKPSRLWNKIKTPSLRDEKFQGYDISMSEQLLDVALMTGNLTPQEVRAYRKMVVAQESMKHNIGREVKRKQAVNVANEAINALKRWR